MFLAPQIKLDLGFIIGASGPKAEKIFSAQQQFIRDMMSSYTISSDATLAGVVLNGISPSLPIKIGSAVTVDFFTRLLFGLDNPRGFSSGSGVSGNLNEALQLARTSLFSVENGARRAVPKSLVVFVDDKKLPETSIRALGTEARALQDAGIKIVVVGIGANVNRQQLQNIFDAWFFPADLPHMDDFVHPVVTVTLPGIIPFVKSFYCHEIINCFPFFF